MLPGLAPHTLSRVSYAAEAKLEKHNGRHVLKSSSNHLHHEKVRLKVLSCT